MAGRPFQRELFGRRAEAGARLAATVAAPPPVWRWGRALRRRGWVLPLTLGLSLGTAGLACRALQPLYQAAASVEAQALAPPVRFAGDVAPATVDSAMVETRAGELGSTAVVAAALRRLPAAQAAALPSRLWRRPRWLRPAAAPTAEEEMQAVLRQLQIVPPAQGQLIQLRFRAPSAGLAETFLRQLIAADLQRAQSAAQAAGRARVDYLAAQARAAQARVETAQAALQQWTRGHGFADPAAQLALATQQWQQLAQAQTTADIAGLQLADAFAAHAATPLPAGSAGAPDAPTELEVRRAEAEAEVRRLAALYRPQAAPLHQAQQVLDSLNASLANLRAQGRAERQRSLSAAQSQARDLAAAVAAQARRQAPLRQAADAFDLAERNLQAQQTVDSGLLDQLQQAVAEAEQVALPLQLADPAQADPRALRPNRLVALAYALALGLALGVGGVGALELVDDRLRLPEAAELAAPLVALLAQLPERAGAPAWAATAAAAAPSGFQRGVEAAATALLRAQQERGVAVVYITSVEAGAGKTTLALHLARLLAQVAPAVLLVDGNRRQPALHRAAGGEAAPGLAELLADQAPVATALRRWRAGDGAAAAALDYLAAGGDRAPATALGLAAGAGAELLAAARARYSWVIVDGGPVCAGPEAGLWAALADACLLVAERGRTPRRAAQRALALLAASGAGGLGVVLNRAPEAEHWVLPALWLAAPEAGRDAHVTPLRQSA